MALEDQVWSSLEVAKIAIRGAVGLLFESNDRLYPIAFLIEEVDGGWGVKKVQVSTVEDSEEAMLQLRMIAQYRQTYMICLASECLSSLRKFHPKEMDAMRSMPDAQQRKMWILHPDIDFYVGVTCLLPESRSDLWTATITSDGVQEFKEGQRMTAPVSIPPVSWSSQIEIAES